MRKFIVRRVAYLILTYWAFITILFLIFRVTPGDPTTLYIPEGMSQAERQATLERYGLTDPLYVQYVDYLRMLLSGDLGTSYRYNAPVWDVLTTKFWNTIFLMAGAMTIAYTFGIAFGAYIGWLRGTAKEKYGMVLALIARSSPEFWIGIVLLSIFVFQLGWFPWGGIREIGAEAPASFFDRYVNWGFVYHLVLPVLTGAIYYMAQPILLMRSSMISVLNTDYIEIKKAEGSRTIRSSTNTPRETRSCRWSRSLRSSLASRSADHSSSRRCSAGPAWGERWSNRSITTITRWLRGVLPDGECRDIHELYR